MENIRLAYQESRRGKASKPGVRRVDEDPEPFLREVQRLLITHEYKSGEYREFVVHERGKDRIVYDVDYFPHRIVHWALMNVIRPILMNVIGPHSFAAMQGRGAHQAVSIVQEWVRTDAEGTKYVYSMDIRKFFPSIDKDLMIEKLERHIKDPDVIWLCKEIVYGFPGTGLPIGDYTSQYFANYYLSNLMRFLKQVYHCVYAIIYMDNLLVFGRTKAWLHRVRRKVEEIVAENRLEVKGNWFIAPVDDMVRGIDWLGYRIFREYTLLKTATKNRIKRKCAEIRAKLDAGGVLDEHDVGTLASYKGILQWGDCWRLADQTIYTIIPRRT